MTFTNSAKNSMISFLLLLVSFQLAAGQNHGQACVVATGDVDCDAAVTFFYCKPNDGDLTNGVCECRVGTVWENNKGKDVCATNAIGGDCNIKGTMAPLCSNNNHLKCDSDNELKNGKCKCKLATELVDGVCVAGFANPCETIPTFGPHCDTKKHLTCNSKNKCECEAGTAIDMTNYPNGGCLVTLGYGEECRGTARVCSKFMKCSGVSGKCGCTTNSEYDPDSDTCMTWIDQPCSTDGMDQPLCLDKAYLTCKTNETSKIGVCECKEENPVYAKKCQAKLGDQCEHKDKVICSPSDHLACDKDDKCGCKPKTGLNEAGNKCHSTYDEPCSLIGVIKPNCLATHFLNCNVKTGKCECSATTNMYDSTTAGPECRSKAGESCSTESGQAEPQCDPNIDMTCRQGKCECNAGLDNDGLGGCKVLGVDGACGDKLECDPTRFLTCTNGKCVCMAGREAKDEKCQGIMHDRCEMGGVVCDDMKGLECVEGVCGCKENFVGNSDQATCSMTGGVAVKEASYFLAGLMVLVVMGSH